MIAASKVPFLFRIKPKFLSWSVQAPHDMAFAALPHLSFASSDSSHILAFLKLLHMLFPFLREPFPPCLRINLLQGIGYALQVAWLSRVGSLFVLSYPYGIYHITAVVIGISDSHSSLAPRGQELNLFYLSLH